MAYEFEPPPKLREVRPVPPPTSASVPEKKHVLPASGWPHLQHWNEGELQRMLAAVPEVDIDGEGGASRRVLEEAVAFKAEGEPAARGEGVVWVREPVPPAKAVRQRWDALGLAVQEGAEAQASLAAARVLDDCGRALRNLPGAAPRTGRGKSDEEPAPPSIAIVRKSLLDGLKLSAQGPVPGDRVPGMVQGLQVGDADRRRVLVELLARVRGREGTEALARRALYDTAPEVRRAAVEALKARPPEESRPLLLAGFRHPWPPVASHAAEALVSLKDAGAVPALQSMLEDPDPSATVPPEADGKPRVREMVRINHLGNCLLCHAPNVGPRGFATGPVPVRGQALPVAYYEERDPTFPLVRADVTYLRQDFSANLHVNGAAPWPADQRFDFVVRTRVATAEEVARQNDRTAPSPQHESVRYTYTALKVLAR